MGRGLRHLGELFAGFLADADAGLAAKGDQAFEALVLALAGDDDLVEAALASLESLLNRVHAVQNFHER
jgi:hypothetical protein